MLGIVPIVLLLVWVGWMCTDSAQESEDWFVVASGLLLLVCMACLPLWA